MAATNIPNDRKSLLWQIEGGERPDGPNALPRWSLYTEEFPDISGQTGCGIVTYSKNTFAYLRASEENANLIVEAVNRHLTALDVTEKNNGL